MEKYNKLSKILLFLGIILAVLAGLFNYEIIKVESDVDMANFICYICTIFCTTFCGIVFGIEMVRNDKTKDKKKK